MDDKHHLNIYHQKRDEFQLAEALLNLTKSPDQKIAVKACEGLMLLVGLPEARSAKIFVECTAFAQIMCSKLAKLVQDRFILKFNSIIINGMGLPLVCALNSKNRSSYAFLTLTLVENT